MGGEKPRVIIVKKGGDYVAAYWKEKKAIIIYEDAFNGKCSKHIPYLKSVVAHEYGHHLQKKLGKVMHSNKNENIAEIAEHSFGELILKNAEYDTDTHERYPVTITVLR